MRCKIESTKQNAHNGLILQLRENHTGCPAQAKAMPPHVAETITTTKSEMSLEKEQLKQSDCTT